jgi:hypothetical protein
MSPMKSRIRSLLILSIFMSPLWGTFSGCSQPDNPEPVKATSPPPPPVAKELEVPKDTTGKTYGSGERYKKAMNKGQ